MGGNPHAKMGKGDRASCSLNPAVTSGNQTQSLGKLITTSQVVNSQQEQIYSSQRDDFSDPDSKLH